MQPSPTVALILLRRSVMPERPTPFVRKFACEQARQEIIDFLRRARA